MDSRMLEDKEGKSTAAQCLDMLNEIDRVVHDLTVESLSKASAIVLANSLVGTIANFKTMLSNLVAECGRLSKDNAELRGKIEKILDPEKEFRKIAKEMNFIDYPATNVGNAIDTRDVPYEKVLPKKDVEFGKKLFKRAFETCNVDDVKIEKGEDKLTEAEIKAYRECTEDSIKNMKVGRKLPSTKGKKSKSNTSPKKGKSSSSRKEKSKR